MKTSIRWIVILLIAVAGFSIFGIGTSYANPDGGSFEVPDVQKDFGQFEQAPQPQKEMPVTPNVQAEESGIWEKISAPFKSAWNWAGEKVSAAWEWSKDMASSAWDGIVEVSPGSLKWL